MSDLTLSGLGGDSWEDRNDSEERVPCELCGIMVGLSEPNVVVLTGGVVTHQYCELEAQRENQSEVWNECN